MNRQKLFIKIFKEIIKHSERDSCYECKQLVKELRLKERMKSWEHRF